jgi:hypothetical protein
MKAHGFQGLRTLISFGPRIQKSVEAKPDGLLLHENMLFSLFPPHLGMRQYWRDLDSLEAWTRSLPHLDWWKNFLKDPGGTAFWHEAYTARGGMEAVYINMRGAKIGFSGFAGVTPARGPMFGARSRLHAGATASAPVTEEEFYREGPAASR